MVKTHFHYAHYGEEKAEEIYATVPVLQPQDVANAVLHALSQPANVQVIHTETWCTHFHMVRS